jgi:hypothetical protein
LFVFDAEDFAVRLEETRLAVVPFAKRPLLTLFNEDLPEKVIADGTIEIRHERVSTEQGQLRNLGANGAVFKHVSISVLREATADLLDTGWPADAVLKGDLD